MHVPTNLPPEERALVAEANGIPLSLIGLARDADGKIISAPPEAAETSPGPVDDGAPVIAFDPAKDAQQQAAFFDAHSADLAGGFATDADLQSAAEATHGDPPAPSVLVAADGETPLAEAPQRPPCSQHDLVATATALLAPLVGGSYQTAHDAAGERISGGLLAVDDYSIAMALDIAAKLHIGAKKLTG